MPAAPVSTGLSELDDVLGGGFIPASMILLVGTAGSGKTILATQFLHHGASKLGEKGIYISIAENKNDYFRNMQSLGMDMKSLDDKKLVKFLDFPTMDHHAMSIHLQDILNEISSSGVKRLVIDSITVFLQSMAQAEARKYLHLLFGLVRSMGVTALILGEIPVGESKIGFGVEEFVVDGIIRLTSAVTDQTEKNELSILKMRGIGVQRRSFEYLIDRLYGGIGIIAFPLRIDSETAPVERLTTGVKGLDKMLDGGVYKNSITLIEGEAGIGKTTLGLHFLFANAQKGAKALYVSFEEPKIQLLRMMDSYGFDYKKLGDRLTIESYVPEALTPLHYYKLLRENVESKGITALVLDTVSTMRHMVAAGAFTSMMRYVQLLSKARGITLFLMHSIAHDQMQPLVSSLADNIIRMCYAKLKGQIICTISVIKERSSSHDKIPRIFEITDKGMIMHGQPYNENLNRD